MSNRKQSKKQVNKNVAANQSSKIFFIILGVIALAIVVAIVVPAIMSTGEKNSTPVNEEVLATLNEDGDVVIQVEDISDTASFYSYDANGTTVGLLAVKASDGTIRTAFDTCEECSGNQRAFFEQEGTLLQCKNCGNVYDVDKVGTERGGCSPIPIMADEKTETDSEIIIPADLIEENADMFKNWKRF
ncbi:MAG: DUF2318 domain-containing protein [Clostridiales bacterium]|nr:DUF2318 domain-containing protein [Clostridiales bacterium]